MPTFHDQCLDNLSPSWAMVPSICHTLWVDFVLASLICEHVEATHLSCDERTGSKNAGQGARTWEKGASMWDSSKCLKTFTAFERWLAAVSHGMVTEPPPGAGLLPVSANFQGANQRAKYTSTFSKKQCCPNIFFSLSVTSF